MTAVTDVCAVLRCCALPSISFLALVRRMVIPLLVTRNFRFVRWLSVELKAAEGR